MDLKMNHKLSPFVLLNGRVKELSVINKIFKIFLLNANENCSIKHDFFVGLSNCVSEKIQKFLCFIPNYHLKRLPLEYSQ